MVQNLIGSLISMAILPKCTLQCYQINLFFLKQEIFCFLFCFLYGIYKHDRYREILVENWNTISSYSYVSILNLKYENSTQGSLEW